MKTPYLNSREIFAYPNGDGWLLYAPLADIAAVCSEEDILKMEDNCLNGREDETLSYILENNKGNIVPITPLEKNTELTILLNQVCNFSCAYCYSKNGRDKTVLEESLLISALDSFITHERGDSLSIVFSGGGDPMLSYNLFRKAVVFAQDKAAERGVEIDLGVVTNGSLLKDKYVDFIKERNVGLVVSCDILKDVHDMQRSHYDVVASTIDQLCAKGLRIGLRSTITPLNVNRMVEMVDELAVRFPAVRSAAFEAVLSKEVFHTAEELRDFYKSFVVNIFKAIRHGEEIGLSIGNTTINNIDSNKVRSCLAKMVVTPQGDLAACSRLSSPLEEAYNFFRFGNVDAGKGLMIDQDRYDLIMSNNINSFKECSSCIAKYHCSGGCLLARKTLPQDYMAAYCDFNREIVSKALINKIEEDGVE